MTDLLSPLSGLLPLLIAQVASPMPDDRSLAVWWLLGLAAAAVIFNQVSTAWKSLTGGLKESPPPALTYPTKDDCNRKHEADKAEKAGIHEALKEREAVTDSKFEVLRLEIKTDIGGLHDKVNACAIAIGEMRGELRGAINHG